MKRPERTLRQLVQWRQELEREALAALAAVQNRLARQQRQLQDLRDWRRGYLRQESARDPRQRLLAVELTRSRAFLASLEVGLQQQQGAIERSGEELEHCRARWVSARAELRVAQTLLERRLREQRKRTLQRERLQLDEFAARGRVVAARGARRPGED